MISFTNLKIWKLLNDKQKLSLFFAFFFMFFTMFLETLSISVLYPVVGIFINKDSDIYIIKYLLNFFNFQNSFYFIILLILIVFVVKNIFIFFFTIYKNKLTSDIHYTISTSLLNKYINNNYLFHTSRNSSLLIRNITHEVPVIHNVLLQFMIFFTEVLVVLGISIFLIYINTLVTFFIFLLGLIVFLLHQIFISNYVKKLGIQKVYHSGEFIKHFMQGLGSIKLTKILGKHDFFSKNFKKHMYEYAKINYLHRSLAEVPRLFIEILAIISLIVLVYFLLIVQEQTLEKSLVFLSIYLASLVRIVPSVSRIISSLTILASSNRSIEVIYNDLNSSSYNEKYLNLNKYKKNYEMVFNKSGTLDINNISFNYPNREKILKDVSFSAKTGEVIGFIGESGSGKSTLVDLIIGILDVNSGTIKYNGNNIQDDLNSWKSNIGYVPQDIYLTDDSIVNNIGFGLETNEIDLKKILSLINALNLENFIQNLADGINTKVGERGIQISGGQLQRIGIARAMYNDPNIIILDEATSALDQHNEDLIINLINKFRKDKIILIVSHKKNSIKICDKAYKLEGGKLKLLHNNE